MNDTHDADSNGGRFQPGETGNSGGRPRGMGPARKLEKLLASKGAELIERAFERACESDEVLGGLLQVIAAAEMSSAVARFQLAAAQAQSNNH